MNISRNNSSSTHITLTVTAGKEDILLAKQASLKHLANKVKIQGFRPGNAPADLVEKNIDPNTLQQEVLNDALNALYAAALSKENIRPMAEPALSLKKFVPYTDLEFTIDIDVLGPTKLGKYKNLKIEKPAVDVTDKDVEEVLERLRVQTAEYKEVDRPVKTGDRAWIDFSGKDAKGVDVQGATGKDYPLQIGSNTFIPGFEDNLVGVKKGESKEFTIPFPKDYGVKMLQGKKVTFTITLNKVEETELPKLDDEFAKKVGNFKTVADLKKDIKEQIKLERTNQAEREYQDLLIKKIVDSSTVEYPESLLDEQMNIVDSEFKQNLVYRGQTFKEYLETAELDEESYKEKELKPAATDRLKTGLVLSAIADEEKITITPEELEIRLQVLKGQYKDNAMQGELDKPENRREIAARMLTEKTVAKLTSLN
jgi:trigger factor